MAEATVPSAIVEKVKTSSKGINYELDKIRSFGIKILYDGGTNLKLVEGNTEIQEIAINSLERKYGQKKMEREEDEFLETLGNGKIEWTICGESSIKFVKLFKKEIEELKELKTIEYKVSDGKKKLPESVNISCELNDFEEVNGILQPIKHLIWQIEPVYFDVDKKDETKAVRFCDKQNFFHAFCMYDKQEREFKIYGIEKKDSDTVIEEWMKQIRTFEKPAKHKQPKSDGASSVIKRTEETKSVHEKNSENEGQTRAEMNSSIQNITTNSNGSKLSSMNEINRDDSAKSSKGYANNSIRSEQDASNYSLATGTINTSYSSLKSSVSERSIQQNGKSSSKLNQEPNTGSVGCGATALYPKRQPGKKSKDGKYEFMIGKMKVLVYKNSVTDLKEMDAVVNAANEKMIHRGGVAYYISKAAGKKMDDECYDYVKNHGSVRVTENFVSTAGNMKCKGIIHAVGPQWHNYRGRQEECAKDVYLTVLKCLQATEQRKWKKLALIAISSGIFGVPKQLCAEMYIKVIVDHSMNDPGSIEEIHFVDINQDILEFVEKAHKLWVKDPSCLAFENALNYEEATSVSGRKTINKKDQKPEASTPSLQKVKGKQDWVHYKVYGMLDLFVCSGSVLEVRDADAIVCSMDTDYNGGLLSQISSAAGQTFEREFQKRQSRVQQPKDKQLFILPGGKLKSKNVIAIVIENYIRDTSQRDLQRLHEYYEYILLSANEEKIARVVLPLVGVVDIRDIRSCCKQLINTILHLAKDVNESNKVSNMKEFHLVNYDRNVTGYLIDVLKDMEQSGGQSYPQPAGDKQTWVIDPMSGGKDYPWIDTIKSDGWMLHKQLEEVPAKSSAGKDKDLKKTMKSSIASKSLKNQSTKLVNANYRMTESIATNLKTSNRNIKKDVNGCPVCLESYPSIEWETLQCGHGLCRDCFKQVQRTSPRCPTCNSIFGTIIGDQPDGQMHYRNLSSSLPGYPKVGTIHIVYSFLDGIQKENHPNPGQRYRGTQRQAYLPNNAEGQTVLHLLRRAFDRRLMFTIGESRSSGKGNRVTFNDIHIKTSQYGGPERYGYPDPEYLTRVQEELRAKGVTE